MGLLRMWNNRKLVLGRNERNLSYIKKYNLKQAKAVADDKLRTKKILAKAGIPTPKLLGVINNHQELQDFDWDSLPKSFVLKPVSGSEGGGIEVFYNRDKDGKWIKADGSRWGIDELTALSLEILDGKYSLHNAPDRIFFEERIRMHKSFQYYAYKGTPDIRIIVFNFLPIMAMIRFPSQESNGKANLILGAVGAGIDISSGVTTTGVSGKSKIVETIPNTKLSVSGLKIPYWNKMLQHSIDASRAAGLGFASVDFLIDRENGPFVVEINARTGLSIQLANSDGLRWRLRKAKGIKVQSTEKGVRLGKYLFGGDIEEDIERISGKNLIGIYESVDLFSKTDKKSIVTTKAKIDTGADATSIDEQLAKQLGYTQELEIFSEILKTVGVPENLTDRNEALKYMHLVDEQIYKLENEHMCCCNLYKSSHGMSLRLVIKLEIKLSDLQFETKANVYNRSQLEFKVIVGRKSLNRFLVEPSRKEE